jgi:acetylornithine deacetylase/succinyl-diaminopimelate desuccinylase-like protein
MKNSSPLKIASPLLLVLSFLITSTAALETPEKSPAKRLRPNSTRRVKPRLPTAPQSLLDPDILLMVSQVNDSLVAQNIQTLVSFGTRNTCSDNSGASPGIGAARNWIQSQFAALPGVQVRLDPWTYTGCGGTRTLHNVIAWIPGTGHPNRLIVIGGHYDSRNTSVNDGVNPAPGANDSGSQAAAVLEAARVMAGHTFDATIVFAAWAGEEQGLLGSAAFVNTNYRTYFPNGTIEFNLTCDIVGGDNTVNSGTALQQFRLFSPGTAREISSGAVGTTDDTSPSRGVMRHIGYWGASYVPTMTMLPQLREDRPNRGSDHKSFIAKSIPGVRFIDVNENLNHQHTANDLYVYVTPAYTARIAQVVLATAASLSRAPTPPRNVVAQRLSSSLVKLTWAAPSSGSPVDHYVISARRTTENFYRTRYVVSGTATTASPRVVEDLGITGGASYFVSVAAVDAAGHESLYGYPEYRCTSSGCVVQTGSTNVTATR